MTLKEKKFQRVIEDFVCANCRARVRGTGYTNHCPQCLFSKHVDINPGDRQAHCGGLMEPMGLDYEKGQYYIRHRCRKCGLIRRNRVQSKDNFEQVIKLSTDLAKK